MSLSWAQRPQKKDRRCIARVNNQPNPVRCNKRGESHCHLLVDTVTADTHS